MIVFYHLKTILSKNPKIKSHSEKNNFILFEKLKYSYIEPATEIGKKILFFFFLIIS